MAIAIFTYQLLHTNNKYKWTKHVNQKTQHDLMDLKTTAKYLLFVGRPTWFYINIFN